MSTLFVPDFPSREDLVISCLWDEERERGKNANYALRDAKLFMRDFF